MDPKYDEFDVAWELKEARRQLANKKVGNQTSWPCWRAIDARHMHMYRQGVCNQRAPPRRLCGERIFRQLPESAVASYSCWPLQDGAQLG